MDMARIDRRGFLTGLGALLTTSALVKPALPVIETMTSTVPHAASWLGSDQFIAVSEDQWQDLLRFGMSIRRGSERIRPEDYFNFFDSPDSE